MEAGSTYVVYFSFFKDCGNEICRTFALIKLGRAKNGLRLLFMDFQLFNCPPFFYEYSTIRSGVAL